MYLAAGMCTGEAHFPSKMPNAYSMACWSVTESCHRVPLLSQMGVVPASETRMGVKLGREWRGKIVSWKQA